MKVLLTSRSDIKRNALQQFLGSDANVQCVDTSDCDNPEQPVGMLGGMLCCKRRILHILSEPMMDSLKFNNIYSIENGIYKDEVDNKCYDIVHIMRYNPSERVFYYARGCRIEFDADVWNRTERASMITPSLGWSITVGATLKQDGKCSDEKNWMKEASGGMDRIDQIKWVLYSLMSSTALNLQVLSANVKYVSNFPKDGILFKDVSGLLSNAKLLSSLIDRSVNYILKTFAGPIDYVVGLEARGFVLGPLIANEIGAGFVMVRKKGKLTPPVISSKYVKEYGTDEFEIQADIIPHNLKPANVLLVDDLLATGGSFACAIQLLQKCLSAPTIVGCFALLQVDELKETAKKTLQDQNIGILLE